MPLMRPLMNGADTSTMLRIPLVIELGIEDIRMQLVQILTPPLPRGVVFHDPYLLGGIDILQRVRSLGLIMTLVSQFYHLGLHPLYLLQMWTLPLIPLPLWI